MEQHGVRINEEALNETGNQFRTRMEELEHQIYELAGEEFLLTSPRQVGAVLFEKLKISDKAKKTKTGQYSTSEITVMLEVKSSDQVEDVIKKLKTLPEVIDVHR